jgi:hypothetical protein
MDEFIVLIKKNDPISIKKFLRNNVIDINESVRLSTPHSRRMINARPIDIAWRHYVQYRNTNALLAADSYDILDVLLNENSMYPQPFDATLLPPDSKLKKFFDFSVHLHTKSPWDAAKDISKYPHICYFFDQFNKSLLLRCWELNPSKVPIEISKSLLLGPTEYFLVRQNLLLQLKSLVRVKTQKICREINDIFLEVSDFMKLSAIVMYPAPIRIFFDYVSSTNVMRTGNVFIIGCKGRRINIDATVSYIAAGLFQFDLSNAAFNEFRGILNAEIDMENLHYFKQYAHRRPVCFQGQLIPFGEIKPLYKIDRQCMRRILFDKIPVPFGVTPPPENKINVLDDIVNDPVRYSALKFLVGFEDDALFEVYHTLRKLRPMHWLWYIDVSLLELDQHCTANQLLKAAYKLSVNTKSPYNYNWQVFLDLYTKYRVVFLFGGMHKLHSELLRRVMQIIQHDIKCERWVTTMDRDHLDGPNLDLYFILPNITPAKLCKFSQLIGQDDYEFFCNASNDTAIFGKRIRLTQDFIMSLDFPMISTSATTDEQCDKILREFIGPYFSCTQINYELFVFCHEVPLDFQRALEALQSKLYDVITNKIFKRTPPHPNKPRIKMIERWLK